jgi:hypothetical protein
MEEEGSQEQDQGETCEAQQDGVNFAFIHRYQGRYGVI